MLEFRHPLPVRTPLGEGYALYVQSGGTFENDVWCVVLDDARILHFRSNDLLYVGNATFGLQRPASAPTPAESMAPGPVVYVPPPTAPAPPWASPTSRLAEVTRSMAERVKP